MRQQRISYRIVLDEIGIIGLTIKLVVFKMEQLLLVMIYS